LIAIDWGTTGFRACRLGGDGVAESRTAAKGILAVPAGRIQRGPQVDERLLERHPVIDGPGYV